MSNSNNARVIREQRIRIDGSPWTHSLPANTSCDCLCGLFDLFQCFRLASLDSFPASWSLLFVALAISLQVRFLQVHTIRTRSELHKARNSLWSELSVAFDSSSVCPRTLRLGACPSAALTGAQACLINSEKWSLEYMLGIYLPSSLSAVSWIYSPSE